MQRLPKWVIPSPMPSVLETESLTAIEMNARLYGAMQTLIDEHNKWVDQVNAQLAEHEAAEKKARKDFETEWTKTLFEYRCSIDQHLAAMKNEIIAEIQGGSA